MQQKLPQKGQFKSAEATGDLIGNKIADKVGKSKEKTKKAEEILHSTRKKTTNY